MSFQILEEHEGIGREGIIQLAVVTKFHEEAAKEVGTNIVVTL
jgi:hypothetical protein